MTRLLQGSQGNRKEGTRSSPSWPGLEGWGKVGAEGIDAALHFHPPTFYSEAPQMILYPNSTLQPLQEGH